MKPETRFQTRVIKKLKLLPNTFWFKHMAVSIRGLPDIMGCVNGTFVAIELKSSAKLKASPLQQYTLANIQGAQGLSFVVHPDNFDEVFEQLKKLSA